MRYDNQSAESKISVPAARGQYQARDLEETERERGNAEFKAGNFTAAVKCYTKCLGLKAGNYVAFSNRAMAYLKLKEYARAVVCKHDLDCNDVPPMFLLCCLIADGQHMCIANRAQSREIAVAA